MKPKTPYRTIMNPFFHARQLIPISGTFVALLLALLLLPACRNAEKHAAPAAPSPAVGEKARFLWPEEGAYTGAYVDFGEGEDDVTLEALEEFEKMAGKHQAAIACGGFWGEQQFPAKILSIIANYGAIPLLFWSPWDKPYMEDRGPDRFSLDSIVAGAWDAYIDAWADGAKAYGKPLLVAFGLEMNGVWFPWAGSYYGGGKIVGEGPDGVRYAGPERFKQAYRYVVDRVRARGVANILWGFHVNHNTMPWEDWNLPGVYYPGDDYVDWLGLSVYGMMNNGGAWNNFQHLFEGAYEQMVAISADKPLVVAEWGVGEYPKAGNKGAWLKDALSLMQYRYPRVKMAVYWHERWQNSDGSFSNLRINSSPGALEAYREAVADPHWLAAPEFAPAP